MITIEELRALEEEALADRETLKIMDILIKDRPYRVATAILAALKSGLGRLKSGTRALAMRW